eukprot:scaffold992_cov116-Cylindrotheca_fusiformis.AAC.25
MISNSIVRLTLLESLLFLLLISHSHAKEALGADSTTKNLIADPTSDDDAVSSNYSSRMEEVELRLPELEVQFICPRDIRQTFDAENIFDEIYKKFLPDLQTTNLAIKSKLDGMSDIPSGKWYYSDCNMTSPQILTTLQAFGSAVFDGSTNLTHLESFFNEEAIKEYFEKNVCSGLHNYRAYVEITSKSFETAFSFDMVEHNLLLLCGGEDLVYLDEETPDAGFLFFGFLVGFVMVGMVASELQKYDRRPRPSGNRRRNDYEGVAAQEVEMRKIEQLQLVGVKELPPTRRVPKGVKEDALQERMEPLPKADKLNWGGRMGRHMLVSTSRRPSLDNLGPHGHDVDISIGTIDHILSASLYIIISC